MPKKKKKEVKKVAKPKVEKEAKKVEKPKEEKKVEKTKKLEDLGTIGLHNLKIHYKGKKVVNGKEYNDVHLINGQTFLLSDRDFKLQHNPPRK